ncbi:MAG: hypothetical protein PHH57_02865 [Candidatus Omnitrophica bacterium]|nr:hypothetical protein [Candidatus Omnitrophota bacterium]
MTHNTLRLQANCMTTAMGIMPHTNVDTALKLALSLDIPYWPQLPNISYYEDMYAQTSENFPGISINTDEEKISFDTSAFEEEMVNYSQKMAESETFALSQQYSDVYHSFLAKDLSKYPAIRGQVTGPVSFGFRVMDENLRPLIYNEEARALLFDFIQRKVNTQYHQLKDKNQNVFVWVDEPGLGWVFSGLSGYSDTQTRQDYRNFWDGLDGPSGLHLCASVNLPYLLELGADILSFDAYQIELMPKGYTGAVADYITNGGIISWGIVPTDSENLSQHTPETLATLLLGYWELVSDNTGVPVKKIAQQSLLAPARCCLKNIGKVGASDDKLESKMRETASLTTEEQLVEKAFEYLRRLSGILRDKFAL